jgi:GNAT superfamily N-acetyltransferase
MRNNHLRIGSQAKGDIMSAAPERRMILRPMEKADLAAALALSMAERWPHRLEDWQLMLDIGQGVVAVLNDEIIGTTMWYPCGDNRATIGMVIISKLHRGGGLGRIIFETALEMSGCTEFVLNATSVAVPLYRKYGFNGISEIRQHQGTSFSIPITLPEPGERVRPMGVRDYDSINAMLQEATGLVRPALTKELLENSQCVVLDRQETVTGFAFFRRFGRGYAVAPVVAPSIKEAKLLIAHWLGSRSGEFIRIDIPAECGLSEWLEEMGIVQVASVLTMIKGDTPVYNAKTARSFAITSQAFG